MIRTSRSPWLWYVAVLAAACSGIEYSGTTKDEEGKTLAGVRIEMTSDPSFYTLSKADGSFLLDRRATAATSRIAGRVAHAVSISERGELCIASARAATVSINLSDIRGRSILARPALCLIPGTNPVPVGGRALQNPGVLFLSVSGENIEIRGQLIRGNNGLISWRESPKGGALPAVGARAQSRAATVLLATKPGYLSARHTAAGDGETGIALILRLGYDADSLSVAKGSAGVYNPDQILNYYFTMNAGDWSALCNDLTNSRYFPAQMRCESDPPIMVGIRRKRSGGTTKVGLKVDINQYIAGQTFHELRKLSLENGISEGSGDVSARDIISEWLAWRLMNLSGALSSRSAFVKVHVNGQYIGTYVNVEQVDKRFLQTRLGNNGGWLFKKSGGARDGQKTREAEEDPYVKYFCYMGVNGNISCAIPSDSIRRKELPDRLHIDQLLRFGAVNAVIANTDSPLFKDNNYYFYDSETGYRTYFPWDLDTGMDSFMDVLQGERGSTFFVQVLFPIWEQRYRIIVENIVSARIPLSVVNGELDRALAVAGAALNDDPAVTGTAQEATSGLKAWWSQRLAGLKTQLGI